MNLNDHYRLDAMKADPLWVMLALARHEKLGLLTNRQFGLLLLVKYAKTQHAVTVRGLADALGVSKPVITRALNTLGALGYAKRNRDDDDRRSIFVSLTDKWRAVLNEAFPPQQAAA